MNDEQLLEWAKIYSSDLYNNYIDRLEQYNAVKGRGGFFAGYEKKMYNEMMSFLEALKKDASLKNPEGKTVQELEEIEKAEAERKAQEEEALKKLEEEDAKKAEEASEVTKQSNEDVAAAEQSEQEETTAGKVEGGGDNYGNRTQQAEVQQAMSDAADAAQQEAYNNYVQNATSGINRSRAGLLADQGTDTTQNVQSNYNANRQLGTSTQNDYLQKMQQAKSYEQQARNMNAGSFLNTMSGLLQGAGSGAALGATI